MSKFRNLPPKWSTLLIAAGFMLLLISLRLLWNAAFHNMEQPYAVAGRLDLSGWNSHQDGTVTLNGEWEFIPGVFIASEPPAAIPTSHLLPVPGNWNEAVQPGESTPYGFGSYRLLITVNPDIDTTYSIRIASVRSASALYVNGRLLAQSGQPGASKEQTLAQNIPYTASFSSDGNRTIEVVIQAANFHDSRNSGLVRAIRFGSEAALARETQLSITMQHIAAIVFLMHAVYGFILYIGGLREKRLLYFALLSIGATMTHLIGSEDKLLHYWFPISYDWGFKLVHLAMSLIAFSLWKCVPLDLPASARKALRGFDALCALGILWSLLVPASYVLMLKYLYSFILTVSVLLALVLMLIAVVKEWKHSALLLFSLIAFACGFSWWGYSLATGVKGVYYPFDFIISTTCFASVWFRSYFQAHLETKKLAAKLQDADKLKDRFLANTSHELRNPLHGILNMSQAVLEREQRLLSPRSVKDLEGVLSVGKRMSLMLNDLLDMMSLKESAPRLHFRSFSLHSVTTGVIDMLQFMCEGKPVQLVNRIPEKFPPIYADENRVIQILFNLLHNGLKFTNEGEVALHAAVREGKAHIEITDTGIGMDEETLQHIFEPYEQGRAEVSMIEGGFGLGLSVSKQLVQLHGSSFKVRSVPGQGSSFTFILPLAESTSVTETEAFMSAATPTAGDDESAKQASAAAQSVLPSTVAPTEAADRPRILVADDDPLNLQVIESILTPEQYDMYTVTSGKKALEVLNVQEWDLVISDVMMPQMSGYELTRTIRRQFNLTELPILLLTARSQPEDIHNGFMSGANDYVTKPVDPLELRSRVQALTEVKRSVREQLRMEAAWLQAQIQPHFLFNTLNAVSALSKIDLERMSRLLQALASFLRDKFRFENIDALTPMEDELNIVRSYLYIEKERFAERLHVVWELDEYRQLKIPLLTIQPLVENAIRHGIMKRARGGKITIRTRNFESYTEVTVQDDGVGIDPHLQPLQRRLDEAAAYSQGIGLRNTDLRLKRHFGSGLHIQSDSGQGTSVSFKINCPAIRPSAIGE